MEFLVGILEVDSFRVVIMLIITLDSKLQNQFTINKVSKG